MWCSSFKYTFLGDSNVQMINKQILMWIIIVLFLDAVLCIVLVS